MTLFSGSKQEYKEDFYKGSLVKIFSLLILGSFLLIMNAKAEVGATNEVRITISAEAMVALPRTAKGLEIQAQVQINKDPAQAAIMKLRGQSCMSAKRKCMGLKFENKVSFNGDNNLQAKKFNFVSMWVDQGYISSKIGYEFLRAMQISDLRSEYAEVFLNGQSQGLYLVTENPEVGMKRAAQTDNIFIGRRAYGARISISEGVKPGALYTDKQFISAFNSITQQLTTKTGHALQVALEEKMNLTRYINWLILNSVLSSGDYSDEVYFYARSDASQIYFDIFAWDYDDLFKRAPHSSQANTSRVKDVKAKIIYSYENPLDVAIADDEVLYNRVKFLTDQMINAPDFDQVISRVIAKVRASIEPYLDRASVLENARRDNYKKPYTKEYILNLLQQRQAEIKARVGVLKTRI